MGLFSRDSIKGPGMIVLQILRACTVITLLTAVAACWVLIIKIDKSIGFFFFDAVSLFFTSTISVFLAISELPLARSYFQRTWPVLADDSGFTWLGLAMLLIGCNILGKLNQPHNGSDEMGLPFWQLVLAAGILSLTFGLLNIICSLIFRDGAQGISARNVRSHGSLAKSPKETYSDQYSVRSNSFRKDKARSKFMSRFWKTDNDGKQSEKPVISHPIPVAHYDVERNAGVDHQWNQDHDDDEDRRSPIVPSVRRPDTALHPMNMNTRNVRRSSMYSEANMSRF